MLSNQKHFNRSTNETNTDLQSDFCETNKEISFKQVFYNYYEIEVKPILGEFEMKMRFVKNKGNMNMLYKCSKK